MTLTKADKGSWLVTVWDALERHAGLDETMDWDEINTAMSWVTEELGLEYNEDGDYVDAR
jgi:hypothetical protein